jgi:DNA-binding CsgD family transcriptional regulator
VLLGRQRERRAIEQALASARSGQSAVLALVGEAGIGKSELLRFAERQAGALEVLQVRGVQSETQLPFAGLSELLRPMLARLGDIPAPQAAALEAALALREAPHVDRFAIGVATLSLLAARAEESPLLVLVDDAHLLDASSAEALRFALRRLLAEPIAVLLAARAGEPSLLDGADLPELLLEGLEPREATQLLGESREEVAARLHAATGGNPLALLELREEEFSVELAYGGPLQVSTRISRAFARRADELPEPTRRLLTLAAACASAELATLERAARELNLDSSQLSHAETAGLIALAQGTVEFRHPLARSAIYSEAPALERRAAHGALARALPASAQDERAWQLALAAAGTDATAAVALEQAARRARARGALAVAAAAFERAATLSPDPAERERRLVEAAELAWASNQPERATSLLARSAAAAGGATAIELTRARLRGRIAVRCGPVRDGLKVLGGLAERVAGSNDELAVSLFAEAVDACFYAGEVRLMQRFSHRMQELAGPASPPRSRFLAAMAAGMSDVLGGERDRRGVSSLRKAVALAESDPELHGDEQLLPWLAMGPLWLRESDAGVRLMTEAAAARARAAVGLLPWLLNRVARHHAATDSWATARVEYDEAQRFARESGQRTELSAALAGLAWLEAREGRAQECRAHAEEALALSAQLGVGLYETWALRALAELALAAGEPAVALERFERVRTRLAELGIGDVDVDPVPELVECCLRLKRSRHAEQLAEEFSRRAQRKGQPWSLARAMRALALIDPDDLRAGELFARALELHARAADAFESACTRLAYGARLRRARRRLDAREQLRAALASFEGLGAHPWAAMAQAELAASGEHARRRDPSTLDELTNQELQIARMLADGRTTREAAAALFLSPKTIEYHLRSAYRKLGVKTRADLARELSTLS